VPNESFASGTRPSWTVRRIAFVTSAKSGLNGHNRRPLLMATIAAAIQARRIKRI